MNKLLAAIHTYSTYSYGTLGFGIVVFYYLLFLGTSLFRGNLRWRRDESGYFRLSSLVPQLTKALMVPLIFTALGLIPMIRFSECATDEPHYCTSSRDDFCLESGDCADIVVMDSKPYDYPRNVNWTATLFNAYGAGVVRFQLLVVITLIAVAGTGTLYALWKLLVVIVWLLSWPFGLIANLLRKIPIRL